MRPLTSAAYAHGLALALPTTVALARPTGVGRAYRLTDDTGRELIRASLA